MLQRLTVLLSVAVCALMIGAQNSLPGKLLYALETKNLEMGRKLYTEISDTDLVLFPDSVLFDYHYLGGWINSEIPNHEKAISHLLEAKRLCEKSLGIHSRVYMEIVNGLGEEYIDLGQYDEAIGIYQEGIVKSVCMRFSAPQYFGTLIMGVQKCYERMGWYNEVPGHLMDAWSFWNKDGTPLDITSYYPLWCLRQFYIRYEMYEKAIETSDEIVTFITERGGINHPELAEELYFRGGALESMGKIDDAIETYRNGLSILESNKLEYDEEYTYYPILGNLLIALIKNERWEDSNIILNKIKKYGAVIGNDEIYNSALSAVAFVLYQNGHYDRALEINSELLGRPLSDEIKRIANYQQEDILYSQQVMRAFPELEKLLNNTEYASNEWFDTAYKLSSAYFRKKDPVKGKELLDLMYKAIPINNAAKDDYYLEILDGLFNACVDQEDYDLALKYTLEKWEYVATIPDITDKYKFICMNNIVVAKTKANRLYGVHDDLDKATMLCQSIYGENSEKYALLLHNRGRVLQLQHKYDEAKQVYLRAIELQLEVRASVLPNTVKYLMETNNQIIDAELD